MSSHRAFVAMFWTCIVLSLTAASLRWGGEIEGRIWPVMGPLEVSDPVPFPPPSYRYVWAGQADKLRDCDFVSVTWYLGPRNGRRVVVRSEFADKPQVRGVGTLFWSNIRIALDPAEVRQNSHADVLHDCGWPWLTKTQFYDGSLGD